MDELDCKIIENIINRCKECKFACCEACEIVYKDVEAIKVLYDIYQNIHEIERENKALKTVIKKKDFLYNDLWKEYKENKKQIEEYKHLLNHYRLITNAKFGLNESEVKLK